MVEQFGFDYQVALRELTLKTKQMGFAAAGQVLGEIPSQADGKRWAQRGGEGAVIAKGTWSPLE